MMKKWIFLLLASAMLMSLFACGGVGSDTEETGESVPTGETAVREPDSSAPVETDPVQAAIAKNHQLSTGHYYIADDGSILVTGDAADSVLGMKYAALSGLKTLVCGYYPEDVYGLTEDGLLYYRDTPILENVADADGNLAEDMARVFFAGDGCVGTISVRHKAAAPDWRVENEYSQSIDVDDMLVTLNTNSVKSKYTAVKAGPYGALLLSDKKSVSTCGSSETLKRAEESYKEYFYWNSMVLVDLDSYMKGDGTEAITIAGIQTDGTVIAIGEFAQEILSWGPLSYLSMSNGLIVGLTPDGSLKMTGCLAQYMAKEVESWKDIAAVEVGRDFAADRIVNAITNDGTIYSCQLKDKKLSETMVFSEAGRIAGDQDLYRFCADGTVYCADRDSGQWEIFAPEA